MNAGSARPSGRRIRHAARVLAAAVLLSALAGVGGAVDRVALVIGNSEYHDPAATLRNPGNDADGMAAALGRLGFEVVLGKDLDTDQFDAKIDEFAATAHGADVTLFFYAGHALQVEGKNWLMPVNAKLDKRRDLERRAVKLDAVMEKMSGTKKLVFLDACRNNPLARELARSMGLSRTEAANRGLARVNGLPGTLVVYATQAGDVASDGEGANSPFTEALLAHIETPGLNVFAMIDEVAQSVFKATNENQMPSIQSSPMGLGSFSLASVAAPSLPSQNAAASAAGGTAMPPPANAAEIILPDGITLADWALLAEDRLNAGDHARLLEEAGAHLREHGRVQSVEAVRDRAVSGLIGEVRVETRRDAPGALERIARLEEAAGARRPEFLRLRARAHGLLGDHAAAEAAHLQWLRSVPQTHPDRREVLSALVRARAGREASERFSELLGRPFSPERKEDSIGWTDLHYAALLDLPGAVAALCDAGMAADARLKSGTPFGGDLKRTLRGLGHKHFEAERVGGATPLMIASLANARSAAAELAACGADVNATNGNGFTPLHYAADLDAREAAELLVGRGADVNATANNGRTPLDLALHEGHHEMYAVLRSHGGRSTSPKEIERRLALSGEQRRLIQMGLASTGHDPGLADGVFGRRTREALRAWQGSKDLDVTGHLTREQSEGLEGLGRTEAARLRVGAESVRKAREAEAFQRFSELLGRPFSPERTEDSVGWTDLHYAALLDLPGAVAALCGAGMAADARLKPGPQPFGNGLKRTLAALGHGNFARRMSVGQTPLMIASYANARNAAAGLADCGADVKATDRDGRSPLHFAAWQNAPEAAKLLIDRGANVNAKDRYGQTPLRFAASRNAPEVVKLLIDAGADVNATNHYGRTPLDALAEHR